MHSRRVLFSALVFSFLFALSLTADPSPLKSKTLTVFGTLTADRATGANPGWSISLNPVLMFDGKQISSLEIKSSDTHKLLFLEDKFVKATGKLKFLDSADSFDRPIFELWSIKERKVKEPKR
jgi:hypothetical protein